jgi:hypothetical protein
MFGDSENRCVEQIINFIKENPLFRSVTLQDEGELMENIDSRRTFLLVKGSYKTTDVLVGILLNYDAASTDRTGSGVSLMYRILCKPGINVIFTRESEYDQVTKRIGPKPEIEIGDKEIDDAFIIYTKDNDRLKWMLPRGTFRSFLLNHANDLERFEMESGFIEYQRAILGNRYQGKEIEKDLEDLSEIVSSLAIEGDRSL